MILSIVYAVFIIAASTDARGITILPRGKQIKKVDSGMILVCSVTYQLQPASNGTNLKDPDLQSIPPSASIKWHGPDLHVITATSGRVYIEHTNERNQLRLYIMRMKREDAGVYKCTANISEVDYLEEETQVDLFEDIQFISTPTTERHLVGSSAILQCQATGAPAPELSWRFNNQRIVPDERKYRLERNGLRLENIDLRDNGTYECRAEVESYGNVKIHYVTLDVLYAPEIVRRPTADSVVQGENTTLQCGAVGNPQVQYEWLKEAESLELEKVLISNGSDVLTLYNVSQADEGRYYCRVTNNHGSTQSHVDIRVQVPPVIETHPVSIVQLEGLNLTASCNASGFPLPNISWSRIPGTFDPVYSDAYLKELGIWIEDSQPGISHIFLSEVSRTYSGALLCTADNLIGTVTKVVIMSIEYKPSVVFNVSELWGLSGQLIYFTCSSNGQPLPQITWQREGEKSDISNSSVYSIVTEHKDGHLISTLSINITSTSAYGRYFCTAQNSRGTATEMGQLMEAVIPGMPQNVFIVEETMTTVTIAASPPFQYERLPVTHWTIQYEVVENKRKVTNLDFPIGSAIVVTDLSPQTTYKFSLYVSNAVAISSPVVFRVTTLRHQINRNNDDNTEKQRIVDDVHSKSANNAVIHRQNETFQVIQRAEDKSYAPPVNMAIASDYSTLLLAIIAGPMLILIVVMIAILWVMVRRRKTDSGYIKSEALTRSGIVMSPENCLMQNRYHDDLQHLNELELDSLCSANEQIRRTPIVPVCVSLVSLGASSSIVTLSHSGTCSCKAQQENWNQTVELKNSCNKDTIDDSLPSSCSLLDVNGSVDAPRLPCIESVTYANAKNKYPIRAIFVNKVPDTYIGGEQVDDDIDQVDFTIRIPSGSSAIFD